MLLSRLLLHMHIASADVFVSNTDTFVKNLYERFLQEFFKRLLIARSITRFQSQHSQYQTIFHQTQMHQRIVSSQESRQKYTMSFPISETWGRHVQQGSFYSMETLQEQVCTWTPVRIMTGNIFKTFRTVRVAHHSSLADWETPPLKTNKTSINT